ncbi:MAG: hypothetical protein ABH851_04425 [Methanobacteriota archaeon]
MSDDGEGLSYLIENLINYIKTTPKGVLIFWTILLIALVYTLNNAWGYIGWFFGG